MKLNSDCVRDTLLYLEDILTINFQHKTLNTVIQEIANDPALIKSVIQILIS